MATEAVARIYQAGYRYSKAEVCCWICASRGVQRRPVRAGPAVGEWPADVGTGRGQRALWAGDAQGRQRARTPEWGMRRAMMSPSYTTRIEQLWTVGSR
jgi:DNA polymerase V